MSNTTFKRWIVQWTEEETETSATLRRVSFVEYEDAVIQAKISGSNSVYDKLEMVWIDL